MLVRLFRLSQPALAAVLLVPAILAACASHSLHFATVPPNGMPFYDLVYNLFSGFHSWVRVAVVTALLYLQAFHLNFILNRHEVVFKESWLPAFMYILVGTLLPPFQWFHPMIFVNTILLFALDKIFYLYKNEKPLALDFDVGFIIGIAGLFYLPLVIFILFFGSALMLLRPFSWRDWAAGIIGVLLPFLFAFCYYFLTDHLVLLYEKIVLSGIKVPLNLKEIFPSAYIYSLALLIIIIVLALFKQQANFYKNVTKTRLNQLVLMLFALTGIVAVFFTETLLLYRFFILTIPFAVWSAYYFLSMKKLWLAELLMTTLIGCWIYNYLGS